MIVPVFFVQNNHVEKLTAPVAVYARSHGIALEDRSSFVGFDPNDCGIDWKAYDVVLPYGSVQFVQKLKKCSLAPFVLHDESCFATSVWVDQLGSDTLNQNGCLTTVDDVENMLRSGAKHLRPDKEDKAFVGGIFDLCKWNEIRSSRGLAGDLSCWASPIQIIDKEWRCWVVGGKIVEISKYRESGHMALEQEKNPEIWEVAQRFANQYLPAPCVVLDIAEVSGNYKVIEFNPIHCAGWYAARIEVVLDAWVEWSKTNMAC
jgi:hypothetical protein